MALIAAGMAPGAETVLPGSVTISKASHTGGTRQHPGHTYLKHNRDAPQASLPEFYSRAHTPGHVRLRLGHEVSIHCQKSWLNLAWTRTPGHARRDLVRGLGALPPQAARRRGPGRRGAAVRVRGRRELLPLGPALQQLEHRLGALVGFGLAAAPAHVIGHSGAPQCLLADMTC